MEIFPGSVSFLRKETILSWAIRYASRLRSTVTAVNYCLAVKLEYPAGIGILADAGERIATVALLPRNDILFVTQSAVLSANSKIFSVIASQCAHWRGNPFPLRLEEPCNALHCKDADCHGRFAPSQ
jgi:hypothetical protein